jgi:muconolactone delta-isomerase
MRFLIVSKNKYMAPPEVMPSLVDATLAWTRKYEKQIEQIWSFAGQQAGGGIADVESLEELNTILGEFPLCLFSETEVYPLVDLVVSLQQQKETLQSISAPV